MLERGESISTDYYKDNCLESLFDNIKQRRPKSGLHAIRLHYDNVKSHQTKDIQIFLEQQGAMLMPHPPCSPDLAPSDFWLFKTTIRYLF